MTGTPLTWDEYAARWAGLHGGVDPRRGSGFVLAWLRMAYGLGRGLARMRVRPAAITVAGLILSLLVPVLVNQGRLWVLGAAWLVLLAAVADSVDGAVAVITRRASRLGYVYDSLVDRVCEVAWLAGLKLVGVPGWLVVVCGALAWLHEYLRARAIAAGMSDVGVVTAAERPTRVVFVFLGLGLGALGGLIAEPLAAGTATAATAMWVLFGLVGFAQLLGSVHGALRRRPARVAHPSDVYDLPRSPGRGAGGPLSVGIPDTPVDSAGGTRGAPAATLSSERPDAATGADPPWSDRAEQH